MCLYGVYKNVNIINKQAKSVVKVDACIADEIQELNNLGVVTIGCCCGHGTAGEIVEYENGYGKWKEYKSPPHALIRKESIEDVKSLGYRPFPYYYADGENHSVYKMFLKTGCITNQDCKEWHDEVNLPFEMYLDVID